MVIVNISVLLKLVMVKYSQHLQKLTIGQVGWEDEQWEIGSVQVNSDFMIGNIIKDIVYT